MTTRMQVLIFHKLLQAFPNVYSPITRYLPTIHSSVFLYHLKMYHLYSLSQINDFQSDLQILTPTLLISHLVKLINF